MRAAERAAGGVRDGHCDLEEQLAFGREAAHAPPVPEGDPQAAHAVDRHAVGEAVALAELDKGAAVWGGFLPPPGGSGNHPPPPTLFGHSPPPPGGTGGGGA